jgi:replication fork protection complex subunit Csm3/Swi3
LEGQNQANNLISPQFSDVAELLHTYQAWLHRLYPRVKFVDGLAMVEKLGHKKDVQRLRCAWIDEGKPKTDRGPDSDHENLSATAGPGTETDPSARQFNITPDVASPPKGDMEAGHDPDHPSLIGHGGPDSEAPQGALEDEDDLDQLLAEEPQDKAAPRRNQSNSTTLSSGGAAPEEDDFDDEEEIIRAMECDDDF